jgi:hypothetical protein
MAFTRTCWWNCWKEMLSNNHEFRTCVRIEALVIYKVFLFVFWWNIKLCTWIDELATDVLENQFWAALYKKKHYEINQKILHLFQMSRQSNQRNENSIHWPGGHEETIKLQKSFLIFTIRIVDNELKLTLNRKCPLLHVLKIIRKWWNDIRIYW